MEMTAQKKPMLMEVVFIRLVLILFLVAYHSFAPYCGAWENFSGQTEIPLFHNFGVVLSSFFLQAFVFISGYIFGYQAGRNPEKLKFGECVAKKAKRLLIPSVVFSTLYYAMFYDLTASPAKIGYTILNGAGHMWFLPMLFWCFVGVWIVERVNINKWIVISLSVSAALLWVSLPLRTGEAAGYFFYFYLGYALKKGTINLSIRHGNIIALVAAFSWAICCAAKITISQNAGLVDFSRGGQLVASHALTFITAISAIVCVMAVGVRLNKGRLRLPDRVLTLSGYCFGIYIFQQIILRYLYYHTEIPAAIPETVLPFAFFGVTLVLSVALTNLTLRTRIGRYLIG